MSCLDGSRIAGDNATDWRGSVAETDLLSREGIPKLYSLDFVSQLTDINFLWYESHGAHDCANRGRVWRG